MSGEKEEAIGLKYGEGVLPFPDELAGDAVMVEPLLPPVVRDPVRAIENSLDSPLDTPPLTGIVRAGESVAVAVPDVTRYSASEIYLPLVVERLRAAGVKEEDITFFVALGIHRRLTEKEVADITGGLSERIPTTQHDPGNNLTFLGTTRAGTAVHVNSDLLGHDRIIATGTVSFHYFAGFGGGRKVIVPGLAGRDTCHTTHFRIFTEGKGKHHLAKAGVLAGNPVHEDLSHASQMVKVDFSLNTCLRPDRTLFASFSGSLAGAHEVACSHYARFFRIELPERLPLVIASAGGFPKDINFIQAHKALDNAFQCVEPGGVIILLAECRDGFGNEDFLSWFRYGDLEEFEEELRKNYFVYGQTAYSALHKARNARVILVSRLGTEDVRKMSMVPARSLPDAVALAKGFVGDISSYYVIPDCGYVLPRVNQPM